jgi:hypothetical protein
MKPDHSIWTAVIHMDRTMVTGCSKNNISHAKVLDTLFVLFEQKEAMVLRCFALPKIAVKKS